MAAQIKVVEALNQPMVRRKLRSPAHKFSVRAKPFEICPFLIAPVLPGETMTNALLQSRVISDPLAAGPGRIIGWHHEMMLFYVSIPAIAEHGNDPDFINMFIDSSVNAAGYALGADTTPLYGFKTGVDWLSPCLAVIRDVFFRDEKDIGIAGTVDQYDGAYADLDRNIFQSAKEESAGSADGDIELPGVDEIEDLDILSGYTTHYAQWEVMRDLNLTEVTFEDYLRAAGVSVGDGDVTNAANSLSQTETVQSVKHKPELLRFTRDWTYPSNTVDPTTGVPTSAVSWSVKERADKHRFFKYPGFVVGVSVTRPKLYLGNQKGAAVGLLQNAIDWLPSVLNGHPYTSLKENLDSATDGIIRTQDEDYWVDLKDLFLYGDQFLNYSLGGFAPALPAVNAPCPKFVTEAMVDALFATTDGTKSYIVQDGVVSMNVLSRMTETT